VLCNLSLVLSMYVCMYIYIYIYIYVIRGCGLAAPLPPQWYGPAGYPLKIKDFSGIPCSRATWAEYGPYEPIIWVPCAPIWSPYSTIWADMGPYEPIWSPWHMAPCGPTWDPDGPHMEPIWAHMRPIWAHMDSI